MPDVFLSYKREDSEAAARLVQALRAEGIEVWWDRDIRPGAPWEATIEKALAEAAVVLVCWSRAAVASDNVRSEARWAREQGRLIQIFVEPCNPPLFFGEHQGIDLAAWSGERDNQRFVELLEVVRERVGARAPHALQSATGPNRTNAPAPVLSPATRHAKRLRLNPPMAVVAVALVLLLAGGGVWLATAVFGAHSARGQEIAVLPFQALSSDPAATYFGEALSEQILANLSRRQIPTISSEDARSLEGPGKQAQARKLGVGLLFDGTVQFDGKLITVEVHLDEPDAHSTLWSARFTGDASKPADLQAQIAARLGAVLNAAGRALRPGNGLSDPTALGLYLHACDLFQTRGGEDNPEVIYELLSTLRQVIAKAPRFAAARSDLAKFETYYVTGSYGGGLPPEQAPQILHEAREQANRALALDPKDADAYVALSLMVPPPGWAERERLLRKALEIDPEWPHANGFLGMMLWEVGRLKESAEYTGRAAAANPLSPEFGWTTQNAIALAAVGQDALADQAVAQLKELWPTDTDVWKTRFWVPAMEGRWSAAEAVVDDPSGRPSYLDSSVTSHVFLHAAQTKSPRDIALARSVILANLASGALAPQAAVWCLASLGLVDDAFAVAAKLPSAPSDSSKYVMLISPDSAPIRRDPRFMALASKLGMLDYWRSTGKWPDFCADPKLPYNCRAVAAKLD